MKANKLRFGLLAITGAGALSLSLLTSPLGASAAGGLGFSIAEVGQYGGEPSIISDSKGVLYDTSPSGPLTYRSTNGGVSWTKIQNADNNSGDDCLAVDQSNALYWCNLASMTASQLPLQADVWKSTIASTCTTNCNWVHGAGVAGSECGTSCNPFGVDRDWTAASILKPGSGTANAEVVLMYHDFYGPSQIWVNISTNGGKSFGAPVEVLANSPTPGAVEAQGYTMCNTVPAGVGIVPPGKPHAGRIFVSWIAADLPQNATGCNITMLQSFHTAWIAWSDDQGATWTAQQAYDAGEGHDMSTPFVAFTLDEQGNPYIAFTTPAPGDVAPTCSADQTSLAKETPVCNYRSWVVWSHDGGSTWDGGGGLIPGSAKTAYEVDATTSIGTDVYPTIAVDDPGKVDVSWLHTDEQVPTDASGKFEPGGCAGPVSGNPPYYPPTCDWYLYGAQSHNLTLAPGKATWSTVKITPHPMHYGDICNLGIFCLDPNSNRNLLDFNMETMDPRGCAHIAYADDNAGTLADPKNPSPYGNHLVVANQTSGCDEPNTPGIAPPGTTGALFMPVGAAAAALFGTRLRRRQQR